MTVKTKVVKRLTNSMASKLPAWEDVDMAWARLDQGQKNRIVGALHAGNLEGIGRVISGEYLKVLRDQAEAEADAILTNGISEDELGRLL